MYANFKDAPVYNEKWKTVGRLTFRFIGQQSAQIHDECDMLAEVEPEQATDGKASGKFVVRTFAPLEGDNDKRRTLTETLHGSLESAVDTMKLLAVEQYYKREGQDDEA